MYRSPQTVDINLHELPRAVRLWLCGKIGWQNPVHFGVVPLFAESSTLKELRERIHAHEKRLTKNIAG